MKREVVVVTQKQISWVIYGIFVLAAAFILGYLLGSGQTAAPVQVTIAQPATPAASLDPAAETAQNSSDGLIDLNTATQEQLETLPGIGRELASRIIAYRQKNGLFVAKEQIMDVEGIGQGRYDKIEAYLTVGGTQ